MSRSWRFGIYLAAAAVLLAAPSPPGPQDRPADERLAKILEKGAYYCWRLDRAALEFICLEEVSEMTNRYRRSFDVFLYDYQTVETEVRYDK